MPLEKIFRAIKKQTGYAVLFNAGDIQKARPVTISVSHAALESFLQQVLKDQPFDYSIENTTIFISKKPETPSGTAPPVQKPSIDISGRVTNEDGDPLQGASIDVIGTKQGTKTDATGAFVLNGLHENSEVEVSYIGHTAIRFRVTSSTTGTVLPSNVPLTSGAGGFSLVLGRAVSALDEMQVIAYGQTSRRFQTGNVVTVKGEDIQKQPVSNPMLALEGRVPGLVITPANGLPGAGVTVRVQGQNSILGGNDPLYVIDGVPYLSQMLPSVNGGPLGGSGGPVFNGVPFGGGNPLNFINPTDIESIEVLKDADATAIYGSRAANGAILITTKKGKVGQTKLDLNVQQGMGRVSRGLDLMNTSQYLAMRREALNNDKVTVSPTDANYDVNGVWDTTRNANWQKELIGGTASYSNASLSVSGGVPTLQYFIGGTYHRETTVFPGDFNDQKGTLHFNINSSSANQRFKIQLTGSYLYDDDRLMTQDLTVFAMSLAPDAPKLYNADGSLNWAPLPSGTSTWMNPLAYQNDRYVNKTNNLLSNLVLSYQLLKGLDFKSSFGYNNLTTNEFLPSPLTAVRPERRPTTSRSAVYSNTTAATWIAEPQFTYRAGFGNWKLEALLGSTIQQTRNVGQQYNGTGYNSDQSLEDIKQASTITIGTSVNSQYKYAAGYGRLKLNWKDKLLLDLTARRDGSSRFGAKNELHNFGSAGAAWIFSEERFFEGARRIISFAKLRASYGTTGNDQIGDYGYFNLYNPVSVGNPYEGVSALAVNGLPNPYLQWEETRKFQTGLDLSFLNDRISLTANYAINRSSNELLAYGLPIFTGYGGIITNFPATVENTSLELMLSAVVIKRKDFSWTTGLNLTIPQNKLVAFPNLAQSTYASSLTVGKSINSAYVYHYLGVDPATGLYLFQSSKGTPTSSPNFSTDRTRLIQTNPGYYGGFDNSFTYKRLRLDVFFQFNKQINTNYYFGNLSGGRPNINQPVWMLNRWQKAGDVAKYQKYNSNFGLFSLISAAQSSDAAYSNAGYARLKNLSLSYQLPINKSPTTGLSDGRLYIDAQNLLTITRYIGVDPETRSTTSLPPLRVITFGIQLSFF
ncbi:MAG TPA: SusC/RagA family TonB-linked outer membrane protein [Puia sp.]|nr:SusC/RagA family TonB-linked outer membrane protein [Puia sp.]